MNETQEALHFLDYWRVIRARKEVVIAVFLLVVVTGVMVTYAMPRYFRSSCVVLVKEESPDVPIFSRETVSYDPFFLRTQFQIIQSRPVVEETVRRLRLDDKLSKAYGYDGDSPEQILDRTVTILANCMRVQQYRDTKLIELRVQLAEPKESAPREAAAAANTLAAVYRDQSMQRTRDATERALRALNDALEEQQKRVARIEATVEDVRQRHQIDVIALGGAGSTASLAKMALQRLVDLRLRTQLELEDKRARWDMVRSLSAKDLLAAAPHLVASGEALRALVASKRTAEVQYETLTRGEGLGKLHPQVAEVESAIRELDAKIGDELSGLRKGVQADYEAAKAKLDAITAELETARAADRGQESSGYREFQKAQEELEHARRIRDALEMRYVQERIEQRIPRTTVEVVEPAKPSDPNDPVSPDFMLNILLSILVGLFAGVGLAYFIEYLDTSLKTVEDIEKYMSVPVIGVIPQRVRPLIENPDAGHAESYRVLRANVQFSDKFKNGRCMCVTSGSVGEGKSLTIFNLGFICAQLGDRVLIVDSDLHRPRQHKILGVSNRAGLANVLVGEMRVEDVVLPTRLDKLSFMPSGKLAAGSVHGLLDSGRMRDLVKSLGEQYDLVLFDAPPMIGVSDASLLVREMDGVLLVVQHRKYPRTVSKRAKDMVENVGGNLVGVVLNNINVSRDYYYYYHHYYSYYPKRPEKEEARAKA